MPGIEPLSMNRMKERIVKNREGRMEEVIDVPVNTSVRTTAFEPLEARIAREKPELLAGLKALKKSVGDEVFAKRFSVQQNVNKSGKKLLIVSGSERLRTMLLRDNMKDIMQAFDVDDVRIVGGASFGGVDAF